jgi:hypothetical protein
LTKIFFPHFDSKNIKYFEIPTLRWGEKKMPSSFALLRDATPSPRFRVSS